MINANPLAQKLLEAYKPISKTMINFQAGIVIDLLFGIIMAAIFVILYKSLPGSTSVLKGLSFGILIWFFRVAMWTASSFVMFKIPLNTLSYSLVVGLIEMLILGLFYGLLLKNDIIFV